MLINYKIPQSFVDVTNYNADEMFVRRLLNIPNCRIVQVSTNRVITKRTVDSVFGQFIHQQPVPSKVWEIQHGLNKFPLVVAFNDKGKEMFGEVEYVNEAKLTITFPHDVIGEAYII